MFSFHYYLFAPILEFVFVSTSAATATTAAAPYCILRLLDVFFFFHRHHHRCEDDSGKVMYLFGRAAATAAAAAAIEKNFVVEPHALVAKNWETVKPGFLFLSTASFITNLASCSPLFFFYADDNDNTVTN